MAEDRRSEDKPDRQAQETNCEVPSGVKLFHTMEGHKGAVRTVAFDPAGEILASGGNDRRIQLWEVASGRLLHTLEGHKEQVLCVAFDRTGRNLISGGADSRVKLWDRSTRRLIYARKGHYSSVLSVAFDPTGRELASGGSDGTVKLWERSSGHLLHTLGSYYNKGLVTSVTFDPTGKILANGSADSRVKLWRQSGGELLRMLEGHQGKVISVTFDHTGKILASGSADRTVKLWDVASGRLLRTLEGHAGMILGVAFSSDSQVLASNSEDGTIRVWRCDTWETVAVIPGPTITHSWVCALAFHPSLPLLATVASAPDASEDDRCKQIHLWTLDLEMLLGKRLSVAPPPKAIHHTTGKIVLVGDHSVGKSALGYRMIYGHFEKQEATHGQQFWVFPALGKRRSDGTECEAILWDFAGQPDYRLVHALFVDDADLALVLFDASDIHDPLHGVGFWLKQLQAGRSRCPIILVPAQTDRGSCTLTVEELVAFCQKHSIAGPIHTSAATGAGVQELVEHMKAMIPWDDKPAIVTTTTFKRIKDFVLDLKEAESHGQIIVTPGELRARLEATDADWRFTDAEMLTAVGHLENYGYVKKLRTSRGEERILLAPELLNNLASSFVLEARRNLKGLGSLEEERLLNGGYAFPELAKLTDIERGILLDAAALLFLEHNVCFRETDPLRMEPYLVFPELINLKKPIEEEKATEEGVAYRVTGPTENVFASLVVLLGYTHTFTRTNQWQNNARYEVGEGLACGFWQEAERDGELDFVLCFGPGVGGPVRTLFQGLFESFLARRNLTVIRYEPLRCTNPQCGHLLDRSVVRQRMKEGKTFAFCNDCGEKLILPKMAEPIQLTREVQAEVEAQRRTADQRTYFEQAIFRVQNYVAEQRIWVPECFISYAWGVPEHERWVEKRLATDLQKAGIGVVLDRWHNTQIGASVARFIERIEKIDRIIMVGTPLYRRKYENKDTRTGYVVAAEVDLIANRLLGTEAQKASVLPLLLDGDKTASLPPLLHGRVHADFREEEAYFRSAFGLILSLYGIAPNDPAVVDLRESLRESLMR
jgi:small GTP-binding protein